MIGIKVIGVFIEEIVDNLMFPAMHIG